MAPKDDNIRDLRGILRDVEDKIDNMKSEQFKVNTELTRLSHVVYGEIKSDQPGLVGDNKKNKEFIESQKKINWTFAGVFGAVMALKELIINK